LARALASNSAVVAESDGNTGIAPLLPLPTMLNVVGVAITGAGCGCGPPLVDALEVLSIVIDEY
jgi:hypothetical protein